MGYRKTEELLREFLEAWFENPCFEVGTRRVGAVTFRQEALLPLVVERLRVAERSVVCEGMLFYLHPDEALCIDLMLTPEALDEKVAQKHAARIQELRDMRYADYLQSPEWRAKRLEALERDGHACRLCGATERLQVHHRTYEHRGDEPLDDLTTLCADCHQTFHNHGELVRPS